MATNLTPQIANQTAAQIPAQISQPVPAPVPQNLQATNSPTPSEIQANAIQQLLALISSHTQANSQETVDYFSRKRK